MKIVLMTRTVISTIDQPFLVVQSSRQRTLRRRRITKLFTLCRERFYGDDSRMRLKIMSAITLEIIARPRNGLDRFQRGRSHRCYFVTMLSFAIMFFSSFLCEKRRSEEYELREF